MRERLTMASDSGFHLLLTACPGTMRGYTVECDDLEGALATAWTLHERGCACWLWDRREGVTVAMSQAACFGCEREGECPESLDVIDEATAVEAFWRSVLP